MLVSSFGTSTVFGYWGFSILGHVLDVLHGAHHRIHCLSLGEFREGWQGREGRAVLVTSDLPDVALVRCLLASGFPCFAFLDEPEDAIAAATRLRNMTPRQAIRFSTQCFSSLSEVLPVPSLQVLRSDCYFSNVNTVIEVILNAVVGFADHDIVRQVLERAAPDLVPGSLLTVGELMLRHSEEALPPGRKLSQQTAEDQHLIKAVADAYRPIFERRELTFLQWPRELFQFARDLDTEYRTIDLVGGARYIIYGPYFFLPRGGWRVTIQFEVIENVSGNEMEADVAIGTSVVTRGRFDLPALGVFKFSLDFVIQDQNLPIEVRMQILKGAIEGDFSLLSASLERIEISEGGNPISLPVKRHVALTSTAAQERG
jgi:hypothetical protein